MKSLEGRRKELVDLLEKLESFPKTRTVRQLQHELKEKLSHIEKRISAASKRSRERKEQESEESRLQRRQEANVERSQWMKGVHYYVRLIHGRVRGTQHEAPYKEILKMFFKRRRGMRVSIPDVIWQNPSL